MARPDLVKARGWARSLRSHPVTPGYSGRRLRIGFACCVASVAALACGGTPSKGNNGASGSGASGGVSPGTGGNSTGAGTGGTSSGTSSGGFAPAPHQPLPRVPDQGGPVLGTVDLVTVDFPGDQLALGGYVEALLASAWLDDVGGEYGIRSGTHVAAYVVPDAGPATVSDADVRLFLASLIDAGALPPPDGGVIYAIEYPLGTTVTSSLGDGCVAFAGYHDYDPTDGVVYAVIPACPFENPIGHSIAHEIFEAASDPQPHVNPGYAFTWSVGESIASFPYVATENTELADLCNTAASLTLGNGLVATRVWSNAAADAGTDPCVPAPAGEIYFTVSPEPGDGGSQKVPGVATAQPGLGQPQTVVFNLTGWSTAPRPDWLLTATVGEATFTPTIFFGRDAGSATVNNGQTATLTVQLPADLPFGSYAGIVVNSVDLADVGASNTASLAVVVE